MNVEISPSIAVLGLLNVLMVCLAFFVRQWMLRQQTEIESLKSKNSGLVNEFHAYQLSSALQFSQKTEMNDNRKELLDALGSINTKIDHITNKLDKKADKP